MRSGTFKKSTWILITIMLGLSFMTLSRSYAAPSIAEEETSKDYMGDGLKAVQIDTRTKVEKLQGDSIKYNLYNDGNNNEIVDNSSYNSSQRISDQHLDKSKQFCGSDAEADLNCNSGNIMQQFSDLKFSNLTSGTRYDADREKWSKAFLSNIITPTPNSQFSKDTMTADKMQDEDFQKAYVKALSAQAFLSIGQQPFIDIMASRTGDKSKHQIMDEAASSRFMNQTWKDKMAGTPPKGALVAGTPPASPEVVLLEIAQMLSFQVWLQYQQYLQMENLQATMGALLVQNVRGAQSAQALIEQGSKIKPPENTTTTTSDGATK